MKPGTRVTVTFAGKLYAGTVLVVSDSEGWYDREGRAHARRYPAKGVTTYLIPAGKALVELDEGWVQVHPTDSLKAI